MKKINSNGSILISLIITLPFLILIVASYLSLSISSFNVARKDQFQTHSQFTADAGTDMAIQEVNQQPSWTGTVGEVELMNDGKVRTTYEVAVTDDGTSNNKIITSTGRTYFPASATTAESVIHIQTTLRSITSGNYSIVTGVGGLVMSNSSKVLGGDVFINGTLTMTNTSQIGLSISPANVYVANQVCPIPADSSYPSECALGQNDNPISIGNNAHIYGNVRANHQFNGANMSNSGLVASSGVVPQALPNHDRAAQKAAVAVTRTGADASCSGFQTKTWAANTKIVGDVTLTHSCVITVEGNVWITGNLDVSNTSAIAVADGLGSSQPVLMVDGSAGATIRNSGLLDLNMLDTGFMLITYWSAASCSPDCVNVTGQDLVNSRAIKTIDLQNSAAGENSIFYARWSAVEVGNTGSIGALVGQTIVLKNSGAITFGTSVGTGTGFWVVDSYKRIF